MFTALLCLACQRRQAAHKPVPSTPSAIATATPSVSAAVPVELPLGLDRVPGEPSIAAHTENANALDALRGSKWEVAIAGFERAVELAPDWLVFRFNRACALARAGRLEQAAQVLEDLLRQDPVNYRSRLRDDADLAALRASPLARNLELVAGARHEQWQRAMNQGVPMQVSAERGRVTDVKGIRFRWVQAGIYLEDTARFVPSGPRITAGPSEPFTPALAASLPGAAGAALVLVGTGNNADTPSIRAARLSFYAAGAEQPAWRWNSPFNDAMLLEIVLAEDGARLRRFSCNSGCAFSGWLSVNAQGHAASHEPDRGEPRLFVNQAGVSLSAGIPTGYRVKPKRLVTPTGDIELPGYAYSGNTAPLVHVVLAPGGRLAALTEWYGDRYATGMTDEVERHRVLLVDLETRSVRERSRGEGWASVRFGPSGALYLQTSGRVRSYREPLGDGAVTLARGLSL
ncbi:MAG: hypothetical protein QM756_08480 [Polyangiaceae bacterium]